MLDREDPGVQLKLSLLGRCLPATSAVVFGDVWRVDGGYTVECVQRGCKRALLIDTLETAEWQRERIRRPEVDFMKGDFANPLFMESFDERFEIGVAFDVLLHQAAMLGTLSLLLAKVDRAFCVAQPMLEEQSAPNSLVYLPGNPAAERLYPLEAPLAEVKLFDPDDINHSSWIWGMTSSFLTAAMHGEGFDLVAEETLGPLPNPRWRWWGAVYERRREPSARHWANYRATPGLWEADW